MKYKVVFGDSVTKNMKLLQKDLTYKTIEELWNESTFCPLHRNGKEFKLWSGQDVLCYSKDNGSIFSTPLEIIRHKVNKDIWKLTDEHNQYIEVTEDHSLIDKNLNEISPMEATHFYDSMALRGKKLYETKIVKKEIIEYNGYVYDICIPETQNFFANNILVHNTDSFGVPTGNKDNFIKNSKNIQKQVQATYDDFCACFNMNENHLKLEFEKTFEKVLFGDAKKRYAGKICYYKGKEVQDMLIMGFELVRSDCSIVAKETQKKFFDMMFLEDKDRKYLTKWLRDRIKTLREDGYSYSELGIPTPLNKPINEYATNLPIVRAVEYSNNELGLDIQVGEKIKLIYVRGNSKTDVIGFREEKELPKDIILDYEKHIDDSIKGKMIRIMDALAWSMDELDYGGSLLDF